jgi:ABC-type lipoprotein export system ATPase subunit
MTNNTTNQNIPLLKLRDVTKTYRVGRVDVNAVQTVNLDIYAGELLAIVGPSGSGKTTLTHIMGGLIKASNGSILLRGNELTYKNDKTMSLYRNSTVGFVFQNYSLLPYYTALENVMVPLIVANIAPSKRKEIATQYLKLVGLEKYMNQRSNQLSGGQRQRVAIARALVMEPELIIADEPTGNLDTKTGGEIMTILRALSQKKNIAVVMVTHNDTLARQCDRMIQIVDGKITETTHAN